MNSGIETGIHRLRVMSDRRPFGSTRAARARSKGEARLPGIERYYKRMPTRRAGRPAALIVCCLAAAAAAQGVPPAAPAARSPQGAPAPGPRGAAAPGGAPAAPALTLHTAWTTELPALPSGSPAFDPRHLFVLLRDNRVAAVALDGGGLSWIADGAASAVAAGDGLAFLAGGDAIEARSAEAGAPAWVYRAGEPLAPMLAWDGGWLLAATAAGDALMLGARDGHLLWRQPLGAPIVARAAMAADRVYILLDDGRVTARRLVDGSAIWERRLGGRPTTLRVLDDCLFVGAEDTYLYCLDAKDGDRRWRWRTGGGITGTPDVDADRVYFVALDNVLRALDRGNGHQRWMRPLGFRPTGGPLLLNELLLVPGMSPELALFRAATGAPAGRLPAGAEPFVPPRVLGPAAAQPGEVTLIVVGRGGTVERLGPAPPPLQARPLAGVPPYVIRDPS